MNSVNLNPFRFTQLSGKASMGSAYLDSQNNREVTGQIGVDEMVWDGSSGTIATFQDSPSLLGLLQGSRDGFACSFLA